MKRSKQAITLGSRPRHAALTTVGTHLQPVVGDSQARRATAAPALEPAAVDQADGLGQAAGAQGCGEGSVRVMHISAPSWLE